MKVVGLPYSGYAKVKSEIGVNSVLNFQREPENKADPTALAVYFKDVKIGYISRQDKYKVGNMNTGICVVNKIRKSYLVTIPGYVID
jgi:hypothetical protein